MQFLSMLLLPMLLPSMLLLSMRLLSMLLLSMRHQSMLLARPPLPLPLPLPRRLLLLPLPLRWLRLRLRLRWLQLRLRQLRFRCLRQRWLRARLQALRLLLRLRPQLLQRLRGGRCAGPHGYPAGLVRRLFRWRRHRRLRYWAGEKGDVGADRGRVLLRQPDVGVGAGVGGLPGQSVRVWLGGGAGEVGMGDVGADRSHGSLLMR
jgi:hypothetical protein